MASLYLASVLLSAAAFGVSHGPQPYRGREGNVVAGDVVVYGGTAAGCVAAIAASRSGAENVVLARCAL